MFIKEYVGLKNTDKLAFYIKMSIWVTKFI